MCCVNNHTASTKIIAKTTPPIATSHGHFGVPLRPTNLEEVSDLISLYRPGPMDSIPEYVEAKAGRKALSIGLLGNPALTPERDAGASSSSTNSERGISSSGRATGNRFLAVMRDVDPPDPRPEPNPFTVGLLIPDEVSTSDGARTGSGGIPGGGLIPPESRGGVRSLRSLLEGDESAAPAELLATAAFCSLPEESPSLSDVTA